MSKEVEIVIDLQGKVKVQLSGYEGQECESEQLVELLGELLDAPEEDKLPEYYEVQAHQVQQG